MYDLTNALGMKVFVLDRFEHHKREGQNHRDAGLSALQELFLKQLPSKVDLIQARRQEAAKIAVFRDWFGQWKAMIGKLDVHAEWEPKVEAASFPIMLMVRHPELFLALYEARAFLMPMPPSMMRDIEALKAKRQARIEYEVDQAQHAWLERRMQAALHEMFNRGPRK